MSKTTVNEIKALIEQGIEDTTLPDRILEILRPFDGKPISKRLATAVEKATGHTVYFDRSISMFHLQIWGNGIEYNDRKSFLLGYTGALGGDSVFSIERFETKHNVCWYAAARERNEHRRALLKDTRWIASMADCLNTLNRERERFVDLTGGSSYNMPPYYELCKLVEGFKP